jgi:ParB-like chromosome segregation protein Spo0J
MGTTISSFEFVDPRSLKAHPDNEAIFGPMNQELDSDPEFLESIERSGVTTPLTITPDGRVLSGHRRLAAALRYKQPTVPATVVRDLSEHDQERLWLESNLQREMSTEQRARWFKRLRNLESQPASDRKQAGVAGKSPGGRAADIAAEKTGWSRQTAVRAATVTDVIDKAEADGNLSRAEELRTLLNTKSVNSAYSAISAPESTEPEFDEAADVRTFTQSEASRFRAAYQTMIRTIDRSHHELEQLPRERHRQYVERLKSLVTDWQSEFPDLEWL